MLPTMAPAKSGHARGSNCSMRARSWSSRTAATASSRGNTSMSCSATRTASDMPASIPQPGRPSCGRGDPHGDRPQLSFPARPYRRVWFINPRGAMAVASDTHLEKTDEQKAITEMVRQFVDNEIIPVAEEYDHEDKFPEPIVEQMKELGLFGVTIPEEYGGMGLDLTTYAMIVEELSRGWISISGVVNTHFIGSYLLLKFGTDEQ